MGKALLRETQAKRMRKETKRPFVLAAVMLAMFMAAVEATIVSTAMPAIVSDLGGFSKYSWIFSAYLLMNSITVLIYGKLSDILGRKPVLSFGIIVFLIGSILCGTASTMEMLIVYRLIQGLGAGAVMPIASTIVGDIYTKEERAKIQGYLSSVWGISAVSGPVLGGLLVEFVSWRFVFWINVPIGILALIGLYIFLHEKTEKKDVQIDYIGALWMFLSVSSLMIVLVEAGVRWEWMSLPVILLLSASLFFFIFFLIQERRALNPMMPFDIWKERSIFIANMTSLTTGIILIGISSFLPAFVQGVMEKSPMIAGFTLTTMSIGWPIASTLAGRLILSIGYRKTSIMGGISLIVGGIIFFLLSKEDGPLMAMFGSFFIGVGMGLSTTSFIVSIQSAVKWNKRGIATATNMFMRNLGSTVGAALLGGIVNSQLAKYLKSESVEADMKLNSTHSLLNPQGASNMSEEMKSALQEGLNFALHHVYIVVLLFAVISFVLILFLPKDKRA
ncbi:MDR family MFS transporter [Bacillus sp. FJAT-47783]|uniref:MDR family MFS transporter n=1 Tax=Bacillus sp. FJAT-47783 TaxID=2922712 RepID=UPI001FADD0A7|nr:MDR family MFS transporter [Bacillus sp. FJAT-47783]